MDENYESVDFSFLNVPLKDNHIDDYDVNVDTTYVRNMRLGCCIDKYAKELLLSDFDLVSFCAKIKNQKSYH